MRAEACVGDHVDGSGVCACFNVSRPFEPGCWRGRCRAGVVGFAHVGGGSGGVPGNQLVVAKRHAPPPSSCQRCVDRAAVGAQLPQSWRLARRGVESGRSGRNEKLVEGSCSRCNGQCAIASGHLGARNYDMPIRDRYLLVASGRGARTCRQHDGQQTDRGEPLAAGSPRGNSPRHLHPRPSSMLTEYDETDADRRSLNSVRPAHLASDRSTYQPTLIDITSLPPGRTGWAAARQIRSGRVHGCTGSTWVANLPTRLHSCLG